MTLRLLLMFFIPLVSLGQTSSIDSIIESKIQSDSENPIFSILLHIEKGGKICYSRGYGTSDKNSQPVTENSKFKIASSTKIFVSTIILQLIEEKKLKLTDKVFQYLNNLNYLQFDNLHSFENISYSNQISVADLLSHRSGLADIFNDRQDEFFSHLLQNPQEQYSPKSIVELYYSFDLNHSSVFEPNKGWHYSDMNYVLLGLIIESIEQLELYETIRNRILIPLKMEDTYFEFYENPTNKGNLVNQYIGKINFSKLNTSFDWAGGGLVSTNQDLSIFIKALFEYELINTESLNKMIDVKYTKESEYRYGLGVYESIYNGKTYFGHYGFYGTYVGYSPESNTAISYSINQAITDFDVHSLISEILKLSE